MFGHSSFLPSLSTACTTNEVDILGDNSALALYQLNWDGSDLSGNYNGTPTALAFGNGEFNDGGIFNGSSSTVALPALGNTFTVTYSFWINPSSLSNNTVINDTVNGQRLVIQVSSSTFSVSNTMLIGFGGTNHHTIGANTVDTGVWQNFVVSISAVNTLAVYKNGSALTVTNQGGATGGNASYTIGSNGAGGELYNGLIDQVRIFNKAVTASEATTLYEEVLCDLPGTTDTTNYPTGTTNTAYYKLDGNATDVTGTYDGTATSMNWTQGRFGSAANFNGSSSQLNLPTSFNTDIIDATGAFTLSMWIKMNDITAVQYLFASNISNNVDLGVNSNALGAGKVIWTIYNGSYAQIISTTTITTSVWYNIVVKYNNGTSELFIDNVSQGTMNKTLIESSIVPTIGYRNTGGGNYTNGLIDQVRVFSTALTAANVTDLYNEVESVPATTDSFGTVLYTGNGTSAGDILNVGGLNFEPGLTWVKNRTVAVNHYLYDSIRGTGAAKALHSNTTSTEATGSTYADNGGVQNFTSNGFTAYRGTDGTYQGTNLNGNNYVAWNWKAGGPAVSNTDGTITSQVSANPNGSFSIVSYTGTGSNTSVGHGLNSAPEFTMMKNLDSATNWNSWTPVSATNQYISLNLNSELKTTAGLSGFSNGAPTSTVVNLDGSSWTNGSGNSQIMYCFASVAGVSKIGSYTGTGNSSNITETLGFSPRFLMVKKTNGISAWLMMDAVRNPSSPFNTFLVAEAAGAEFVANALAFSYNSTSFTVANTDGTFNTIGGEYMYLAIA